MAKDKEVCIVPYILSNVLLDVDITMEYDWETQKNHSRLYDVSDVVKSLSGSMTKTGKGSDADDIEIGM